MSIKIKFYSHPMFSLPSCNFALTIKKNILLAISRLFPKTKTRIVPKIEIEFGLISTACFIVK